MSNVKIISEHNRVRLVQLKEVKLPNFSHQFNFLNICINHVWIRGCCMAGFDCICKLS